MAQKVRTILVDDIEGTDITEGGQTIRFSLDGVTHEIDLSDKNAKKMRETFQVYIDHGRRVGGRRQSGTGRTRRDPLQTRAIKEWADRQGLDYPERGRLPQDLIDKYEAAR